MKALYLLGTLILFSFSTSLAQCNAVPDSFCIQLGEPFSFNVTDNDLPDSSACPVRLELPDDCIDLQPDGTLLLLDESPTCCGTRNLLYFYEPCDGSAPCFAELTVVIKCPKPECFIVDLTAFSGGTDPVGGGEPPCVYACENNESTYYVPYVASSSYAWSVSGGTFSAGTNPAEINVIWGAAGSGTITLTITDAGGGITTLDICVEVLESPVAAFTTANACVCKNGPISFTNLTTGASDFFWDFGDGNTATSFSPTHTYDNPGTYTVTLYATRANFAADGSPLCCCADSATLTVTVDSLEGPNIYWVSTLCAGDSTKYWTDATGCGTYDWTVYDENGDTISFYDDGNDTICVVWGAGPVGTVQLQVSGCDSAYCDKPTSVTVPIIPATTGINGPIVVCENATETYTVPKWMSTLYNWNVTGGTVISGQGTNTAVIQWGTAPGPGIINLSWNSSFLGGLPGQDPADCMGSATLNVAIKPEFSISGPVPGTACVNSNSLFFASPAAAYTWTVTPAASFTGQGTASIDVTWNTGPGTYIVSAVPNDTTQFCNDSDRWVMTIKDVPPPDSISGPDEICPGETATYFGHGLASGVVFNWTVTGGTPSSFTGDPISVTWNPSGPYGLSLSQSLLASPFCTSTSIFDTITAKSLVGPLAISGSGTCVNDVGIYTLSPAQHPDAVLTWTISPATAGSVISGQGTDSVQVQWNNDAGPVTLTATAELCGQTLSVGLPLVLTAAAVPVITQSGPLCPGETTVLNAGAGYASYNWSSGDTTQTTVVGPGTYTVTVTDANGCETTASYEAIALPAPVASISTPDPKTLCTVPPNSNTVTLYAQTNPNYQFDWHCNNVSQGFPLTQDTLVHTNTNVPGTFLYYVVVTDISTGCIDTSNVIVVVQTDICTGTGSGCDPRDHTVSVVATNQTPNCNVVDFAVSTTGPVTLGSWNFGDPAGNVNSGTLTAAQHTYTTAGYFNAGLSYTVPANPPDTSICLLGVNVPVCIPLAAKFSAVDSCDKVSFTDLSTFLPGNDVTGWSWNFGDAGTSTMQNPMHFYAAPGTYPVTLTVSNANGCQATFTLSVTVDPPPVPGIAINPNPACVGDPVAFTGSGTSISTWLWDFGDGATNGAQSPSHAYDSAATYLVTLNVTNAQGCAGMATANMVVHPLPPLDTITYAPSLTICEGETVTLTAPAGYSYMWTTGDSVASIVTGTAGSYGVTITDANGCSRILDPVTVTVIPKPVATISGKLIICDDGCTTLSAPEGFGFTYQWIDNTGSAVPGGTLSMLTVCDTNLLAGYQVIVTNANGCADTSALAVVSVAVSPSFTVAIAGDTCEGMPNVLSVTPVQPNVTYTWSNGDTGPSTTVLVAGTYTAIGTDTTTGCTHAASAVIHPLPDLCLVPSGCYEVCNPDTICGPDGLAAYQWNFNGTPIPGETGPCLEVTASGSYSLTGTTDFGCELTSDTLILMVIPCDENPCDSTDVSAEPIASAADSCCWSLSLYNGLASTYIGVQIDVLGGLDLGYNGSPAGWNLIGSSASSATLVPPLLGFVPTGAFSGSLADMATFCLGGYTDSVQTVVVSWLVPGPLPLGYAISCTDTLTFNCQPEGCVSIVDDSIYCEGDTVKYSFYVVNGRWDEALESLVLHVDSTLNVTVAPDSLNFPPNAPLDTAGPFVVCITGPDAVFGHVFSFSLSAHDGPIFPDGPDPGFCCADTSMYHIPFPECAPCQYVQSIAKKDSMDCCYTVSLINSLDSNYFCAVQTELITPGATFGTITGAFPLGWVYNLDAPNSITWNRIPLGSDIPLGLTNLPSLCLGGHYPANVELVVHWLVPSGEGKVIACSDTLDLICEPTPDPCVTILQDSLYCNDEGVYVYQFQVVNNSGYTIDKVSFTDLVPAGLALGDVFLTLADGDTSAVFSTVLTGGMAGDTVCFRATLHDITAGYSFACCSEDSLRCYVLPPCGQQEPCVEDIILDDQVKILSNTSVIIDVLANDLCPPGYNIDPSTVTVVVPPASGIIVSINPSTGQISYSTAPNYVGIDCFTYEVCCVDAVGNTSCCTAQVCVKVCGITVKPDNPDHVLNASTATLTWDPVTESEACQVQATRVSPAPNITRNRTVSGFEASSTTVPFSILGVGSTWAWRVRCACTISPVQATPFSDYDTFTVPTPRLPEDVLLREVALYPNPVRDQLRVETAGFAGETVALRIVDASGRVVLERLVQLDAMLHSELLNVDALPIGAYALQAVWNGDARTLRFVKVE